MSVEQYHAVAIQQRSDGALVLALGTQVLVRLSDTEVLASLYSDFAGVVPKGNPFFVDPTFANIDFFTGPGHYHITLTKAGYTWQDDLTHIAIGSASLRQHTYTTVIATPGAQLLAEDAIPIGARVIEVTVTNVVAAGVTGGLTSYNIGDVSLPDKWGYQISLALNHVTNKADYTSSDETIYPTGGDIVLTSVGGLFDADGEWLVDVMYE